MVLRSLVVLIILLPALASPGFAAFRKVSKERCRTFFAEATQDLDEDLVVVPFVRRHLKDIYEVLNAATKNEAELVAAVVEEDIRRAAYRMEALAKTLRDVDEVAYESILVEFKSLEKSVGDYIFEGEMVDLIHHDALLKETLTPEIEALFIGRTSATRDRMLGHFRRQGWMDSKDAYDRIFAIIGDSEPIWKKGKLKKFAAEAMADRLRKIEKKIVKGKLNPNEIEDGVHELRRQIRVVLLTATAFDGLFHLDEDYRILDGAIPKTPAFKWLVPKEKKLVGNPIVLPKDGYFALVELVKTLGTMKSGDGLKEFVTKALTDAKLGRQAKPMLDALDSPVSQASLNATRKQARDLFAEIAGSKLLSKMADALEDN